VRIEGPAVETYLKDPFLAEIADELRRCRSIRPIVVDLTHRCNLRCKGCYFFAEGMDTHRMPRMIDEFDAFILREKERGTNYMTVVGGEPALEMARLKKLHDNFNILPYTNGLIRIPDEGFEDLSIAVSLWGGHETDKMLRGSEKVDVFARALKNYKDDPRVVWYYTTTSGNASEIMPVVEEIVANGNLVTFSFYEDHENLGDRFDHEGGFADVRREIGRAIERFPEWILSTSYLADVGTTNRLYDLTWGHDVCPAVSVDNAKNALRVLNGNPYSAHMRCYMPDLKTTRRCPVGEDHPCSACYNVLAKMTWVAINPEMHMRAQADFARWLTTTYIFHIFIGMIPRPVGARRLPEIHARLRALN
jgi:organic radical activating enzyme